VIGAIRGSLFLVLCFADADWSGRIAESSHLKARFPRAENAEYNTMATPWPDKPCPYCHQVITDLLLEMVPDAERAKPGYKAINDRKPGGAITCPYCQEAVEYAQNGDDLAPSSLIPFRFSRAKTVERAKRFGEVFLDQPETTPEEWAEHDKGMSGAFRGYRYAEDS
jgi:hypothetical protein